MTGYPHSHPRPYPHPHSHPASQFAGAYLPPHPVEGPPPCPDGYDLDPETQKCVVQSLGWPYETPPQPSDGSRVGYDWSQLAYAVPGGPLAIPIVEAAGRNFFGSDPRGGAGAGGRAGSDGSGSGGGLFSPFAPEPSGFDWKGVLEWGAIAAVVVGGFLVYEMIQTQRATSAGALRGLLAAAEERGG